MNDYIRSPIKISWFDQSPSPVYPDPETDEYYYLGPGWYTHWRDEDGNQWGGPYETEQLARVACLERSPAYTLYQNNIWHICTGRNEPEHASELFETELHYM